MGFYIAKVFQNFEALSFIKHKPSHLSRVITYLVFEGDNDQFITQSFHFRFSIIIQVLITKDFFQKKIMTACLKQFI